MEVRKRRKGLYEVCIKRLADIICSAAGLVLLSPIFLLLAIMVRLNLGTPVIFKQKRPGKNEKIFILYKFRTMKEKSDTTGNLLPDEQRLTKFGKWLRSTSMDELPELWNILKGDMSMIGPRPLLAEYLPLYNEKQRKRHCVRPGLTGLAQVRGRNLLSWEEKFQLDIKYVHNITFRQDMNIFFATLHVVAQKKGIHAQDEVTIVPFMGN